MGNMNRIYPIITVLLLSFSLNSFADDRPNILWITVEDMSPTLGCYGDAYARTPNVDQLARESVLYTNAFATSPVCSPSRSTLITGVYSTSLGTHDLRSSFPLPDFVNAWPAALRSKGYYTTNNVKTDYNTCDEQRLIAEAWNQNSDEAHWRNRRSDKPFFAVFNDMTTHQSRTGVWPHERFVEQVQSRLSPEQIHDPKHAPIPAYYPDTPEIRRGVARFYDCVSVMDQNVGKLIGQLKEDGLYEDTIIFYYSDHGSGMPRGKRVLHDSGMKVPLLIRFPEKYQHLAPAAPGEKTDRLVSFVDFPATVLSLLGLEIPDYMQGKPFLGEQAGAPREFLFGARDRVDEAYDKARSVRDKKYLYIRNFRPDLSLNQPTAYSDFSEVRQTITRLASQGKLNSIQLSYAGPNRPAEELYDVERDPDNLKNLAGEVEFSDVLQRMRKVQRSWMQQTCDLGFVPEEVTWNALHNHFTPYEWARAYDQFPSDENLNAAQLIGKGKGAFAKQIEMIQHDDPGIQLHGINGLRSQDELPSQAIASLRTATKDENAVIRIEAASLLGDTEILGKELQSEDENLVLRSSRALELLGSKSSGQIPIMQKTLDKWKTRDKSPIPLFIRFSLETALTKLGHPPDDKFQP